MPLRLCLGYGDERCTELVTKSRCPRHEQQRERARRPSARQRGYTGDYETTRAATLAASTICWLCGHPGADQGDHVVPRSQGGGHREGGLRPAHGTRPCPTCGIRCNQVRGNASPNVDHTT